MTLQSTQQPLIEEHVVSRWMMMLQLLIKSTSLLIRLKRLKCVFPLHFHLVLWRHQINICYLTAVACCGTSHPRCFPDRLHHQAITNVCETVVLYPLWTRGAEQSISRAFSNGISDVRSSVIEGLKLKIVHCECLRLNHIKGGLVQLQLRIFDLWKIWFILQFPNKCKYSTNQHALFTNNCLLFRTTLWSRMDIFLLSFYDNKHYSASVTISQTRTHHHEASSYFVNRYERKIRASGKPLIFLRPDPSKPADRWYI